MVAWIDNWISDCINFNNNLCFVDGALKMVSTGENKQSLDKLMKEIMMTDKTESYTRIYYLEEGVKPSEFLKNHSVETPQGLLIIHGWVVPGFYEREYLAERLIAKNLAALVVKTVPPSERLNMSFILIDKGYQPPFHFWKGLEKAAYEL